MPERAGDPTPGPRSRRNRVEQAGDPEVHEAGVPLLVEDHVGGLHVQVNEPRPVRVVEGRRDLDHDASCLIQSERSAAPQAIGDGIAFDQLEHDRDRVVVLDDVEDRNDPGVGEGGRGARLGDQTVPGAGIGQDVGSQELHGDGAIKSLVVAAPHLGVAPGADAPLEDVPIADAQAASPRGSIWSHAQSIPRIGSAADASGRSELWRVRCRSHDARLPLPRRAVPVGGCYPSSGP